MWVFEPIESVCIFHTLLFFHVWWTYVRCISRTCVTIFRNICHWLHELENDRGIRFTTMAQISIFPKEKKNDNIRLPFWAVMWAFYFLSPDMSTLIPQNMFPYPFQASNLRLSYEKCLWSTWNEFGKRISVGVFHICIYYLKKKKRKEKKRKRKERMYTKKIKSF